MSTEEWAKARAEKIIGGHYVCEDCWYSCPKSGECCNDDSSSSDECNCGRDKRVDAVAAALCDVGGDHTLADASWKVTAQIAQAERDDLRAELAKAHAYIDKISGDNGVLSRQLAEVAERPVCDCHTWPTVKEMHDYCEALERELAEARATLKTADELISEVMHAHRECEKDLCAWYEQWRTAQKEKK
jgi:hypothetical protein